MSRIADVRAETGKYGEIKKQKQFMITDSASSWLDDIAEARKTTRSEAIEQIIREEALRINLKSFVAA